MMGGLETKWALWGGRGNCGRWGRFKFILWTQSSVSLYALPLSLALKWGLISLSYLPQTSKCFQRSSCFHFSQWHHNNNFFFLFSSVPQSCPALCDPMNCSMPGLPVHHKLPEPTQTHVHWVDDATQPFHPLLSPSPHALNLSQNQGLFKWVSSSHQVAKILEFQLQHQSFQWIPRTDLL